MNENEDFFDDANEMLIEERHTKRLLDEIHLNGFRDAHQVKNNLFKHLSIYLTIKSI